MSKFASLTAGLLARKGEAEPAATPFADELLTRVGAPSSDIRPLTPMPHHHDHDNGQPAPLAQQLQQMPAPTPMPAAKPPAAKPLGGDPIFGSFGRRTPAEFDRTRQSEATITQLHPDEDEHADNHCGTCPGPGPEDGTKTFHVNLRLKRRRFVKLKLSAALLRRPVQEVVSEALDQWFDKLPPDVLGDCACLKARGD